MKPACIFKEDVRVLLQNLSNFLEVVVRSDKTGDIGQHNYPLRISCMLSFHLKGV